VLIVVASFMFVALMRFAMTERQIRSLTRQARWERERRRVLDEQGLDAFLGFPPLD
jgi:hypothetical protein